jgi:hypothetical protein
MKMGGEQMTIDEVIEIGSKSAEGLGYAHEKGLIHRDIKPANIIISDKGNPIIMDFGIAKIMGGTQHTATGAVLGTARYMSPEQIKGEKIDPGTDFYSLGVMLFEMLGGRPPFEADSAMTLMMMHMSDPVPDLSKIRADIPPELVAVINKTLAKDSKDRYQTGQELAEALRNAGSKGAAVPIAATMVDPEIPTANTAAAAGETVAAAADTGSPAPPSAPVPPAAGGGSRSLLYGVGAVILLIIFAGGIWAVFFRDSGNVEAESGGGEIVTTATEAAEAATPEQTQEAAAGGSAETAEPQALQGIEADGTITYSFDGRVYRVAAQEGAAPEDISQALDQLSPGKDDELLNISPDGDWLVLESGRFDDECRDWSCLAVVSADLSSGDAVRADGQVIHSEGFSAIASGGNLVIYGAGDSVHERDLWAVTRAGDSWGTPLLLTADSPYEFNYQPALSDDGSTVLFNCGPESFAGEGAAICEVSSSGADFRVVLTPADSPAGFPTSGALHQPDYAPDGTVVFEGDWGNEQIWRLPAGASEPVPVTNAFGNDNSPCVLPNGRIVSLWLNRPEGSGDHEFKVMTPDGSSYFMVLPDLDVLDAGIGCAR